MEKETIKKDMLSQIIDALVTARVEEEVKRDSTYLHLAKEQKKVEKQCYGLEFVKEEREFLKEYFAAKEESCIAFSWCAYKTGFWDCLAILSELKIIGEKKANGYKEAPIHSM